MSALFCLNIVYYTDLHGRFLSEPDTYGMSRSCGIDRLPTYVNRLKQNGEHVLLIDNGDTIQGSHLVDCFDYRNPELGELQHPLTIAHRELGVDCFIVGNHEFTFGKQRLDRIYKEATIPWLASNIVCASHRQPYFQSYSLLQFDAYTVGVMGFTTERIPFREERRSPGSIVFANVVESARKLLPEVKEQCDFLVVAYHGGVEKNPQTKKPIVGVDTVENQGIKLWEDFPQIDLLLLGHQHCKLLVRPAAEETAPLLLAGSKGQLWGHARLTGSSKNSRNKTKLRVDQCRLVESHSVQPDRAFSEHFKEHRRIIRRYLEEPVGSAGEEFAIRDPMQEVWLKNHPFIQWINEVMCTRARVDISAISLLEMGLPGLPRFVRRKDILENYFFANSICVLRVTGEILREALEQAAGFFCLETEDNGRKKPGIHPDWRRFKVRCNDYDIWYGIEYGFDLRREIGSRLLWARYQGKEIAEDDQLRLAVTDYRAQEKFYAMFSQKQIEVSYPDLIPDLLIHDLKRRKHLAIDVKQNFKAIH